MTCRICKKHACAESLHSIEEIEEFEKKQEAEKADEYGGDRDKK